MAWIRLIEIESCGKQKHFLLISLMNENLCFDVIFDQLSYIFTSFSKGKLHLKLWAIFADFLYVKKITE